MTVSHGRVVGFYRDALVVGGHPREDEHVEEYEGREQEELIRLLFVNIIH